jgi:regulator of RNase E activity RraA
MMSFVMLTDRQWSSLERADSPTVANVIELFGIRSQVAGYVNSSVKAIYPEFPPVVGYAVTATFRTGYPETAENAYGGMPRFLEESDDFPTPRIAVFQDLDDPPRGATYGEVMASALQGFGFVGLVTNGAARDIEQVRAMKFPCWASSAFVSHGHPRFVEALVPVVIGGLQVRTGDLLHADANGILHIPDRIAGAVAELCEPFMEAESIAIDYARSPDPTVTGYKEAASRMADAMMALRERARRLMEAGG